MTKEEIAGTLLCHGAKFDVDDRTVGDVCDVSLPMMRRLIKAGLNINCAPDVEGGLSPLQYASRKGMIEVVKLLLASGADINMLPAETRGHTALQGAVKGQHIRVVELLLSNGADVNGPPSKAWGATALQQAALVGSLPLVVLLLRKGADVNGPPSKWYGATALQQAALVGSLPLVVLLLRKGADVNAPAAEGGRTALKAAAEQGRLEITHLLLNADKEPATLQTRCMKAAELARLEGFPIVGDALQEWKERNAAASSDTMPTYGTAQHARQLHIP